MKRLQGKKVVLREKYIADAQKDYVWATDRELMRLDAAEPYPMDYSVYMIEYPHGLADTGKIQFAIETMEGEHIGNCTCYNIDMHAQEAELGIMIGDRSYWGKGYGSDAVKTLIRYILRELGLRRISLHTLTWNVRAQECFERCGFTHCGCVIKQGREFVKMEALFYDEG
ncbi:MAG: GNAT family N-acetyltransferase [Dehalococcoidia bacterium]